MALPTKQAAVVPLPVQPPGRTTRRRINSETLLAVALVSPSIIAILIFVYGFIAWSGRVSLSAWKGLTPDYTFVRLDNYIGLFSDRRFQIDVRNTVLFTTLFVGGCL